MPANRPLGVTLAAVVSIVGSGLLTLFGTGEALFALSPPPNYPPYLKSALLAISFVMLGFAAWGITTAVGLLRLKGWSRPSILTIATLLTFFCGVTAFSTSWTPFPPAGGASTAMMTAVKFGLVTFLGGLTLLGSFWLYYFNRKYIREQFGAETVARRPLSVSAIAWFLLIWGSVTCGACSLLSPPAIVLGLTIQGSFARPLYMIFGAIGIWLGIGLLNLKPWSWTFAIVFFVFSNVNSLLYVVLPGFDERMRASIAALPPSLRDASQQGALSGAAAGLAAGALGCADLYPVGWST